MSNKKFNINNSHSPIPSSPSLIFLLTFHTIRSKGTANCQANRENRGCIAFIEAMGYSVIESHFSGGLEVYHRRLEE